MLLFHSFFTVSVIIKNKISRTPKTGSGQSKGNIDCFQLIEGRISLSPAKQVFEE